MSDGVRLATLASIVEAGAASRDLHGITRVDTVVPAGHYKRRRTAGVETTDLTPRENIFHQYINSLVQSFGPIRRFVLRDALVTDQGAVVTRGGALVDESCWELLQRGQAPMGLRREEADGFRLTEQSVLRLDVPSLLLKRPWWRNYGHWLVDAAALIALLAKRNVAGFEQLVLGAPEDAKLREIMRETLSFVAPEIPVVEHPDAAMWSFSELHYVTPVRRPPMCTIPEAIEALRLAVLGYRPVTPGDRRLFISRRNYDRRRLVNEAEIIETCARHGFEVVYPELWSLREQAALFRSASAIVGVKGAALVNLVFSPPETAVFALSPADFADPFFWDIAGAEGLPYCEMFGALTTTDHKQGLNPFTIDTNRLDLMLRDVLPTPARYLTDRAYAPPPVATRALENTMIDGENNISIELSGEFYKTCLARVHAKTRPRTYLEIGTLHGDTLALSRSRSVAVDPKFQFTEAVPGAMPSLFLFQGPSDAFFDEHDPRTLLGGPVDLAFLDGMHLFEFLLRDFMNTERHCHHGSMVILHDCVPPELGLTSRNMREVHARRSARYPGWWTGDVWKTVDILMQYRPDLDVVALDAPPTGLVVVRNLDPSSTVLNMQYDAIVEQFTNRPDLPAFSDYIGKLPLYNTSMVDWFDPIEFVRTAPGR